MATSPTAYFTVGSNLAGKTLSQLQQSSGLAFRPDVLGGQLGVNPNTPLTAGQSLGFTGNLGDTGAGEVQAVNQIFGSSISPDMYQAQQQNQFIQQQNQPYINALGSAIPTIQNQYQDIINQIQTANKQEFAQRGIPTNSFAAQQAIGSAQIPASNQEAAALQNIYSQIGQLQSGNPQAALQGGLQSWIAQQNNAIQQAQLPGQLQAQQIQNQLAQYLPIAGLGALNVNTNQLVSPYGVQGLGGNLSGGIPQIQNINGQPYINIP